MISPALEDDALLADVAAAPGQEGQFHLWWLGQSGFLLKWGEATLLLDPYLSDSLTQKYAGTDKEHIRMTRRCVAPERLGFIDAVTSSHAHTDHFDAETLLPLGLAHGAPLPLVLPAANLTLARERLAGGNFQLLPIDDSQTIRAGAFEFTGAPSAHDEVEYDAGGHCRFLGYIVRFGDWTVYHSGDTRWHGGLPLILKVYRPDVALLPINGHDPARRVAGNLNGEEAAALARECHAGIAIPHHFEMFTFNTASPDEFVGACERLSQPHRVLRCGERFTWPQPVW